MTSGQRAEFIDEVADAMLSWRKQHLRMFLCHANRIQHQHQRFTAAQWPRGTASIKAKFDPAGYDAKLMPAAEAFERRQWEAGMKLLTPLRKSSTKAVAESANKLYEAVKSEGETWKSEAEQAAASDPVKAYDLYSRLVAVFPSEPAFKDAAEAKRKLANGKAVTAELAARKAYPAFLGLVAGAAPGQEAQVAKLAQAFVKKHPGTPTAERVAELEKELPKKP